MCTQDVINYRCGCKATGEFHQCDERYNEQSNLKCDRVPKTNIDSRNYCAKHLVAAGKAKDEYVTRRETGNR